MYLIVGERGVRIGQSQCIETRIARVKRELEDCIGNAEHVLRIPVVDQVTRLALERELMQALDPKCNVIGRRRNDENRQPR